MGTLKVNNPVILLDEVDKMSQNQMFNPQATLLEILDPEQNHTFKDHYVNTAFDLSKVLFIATANDTSLIDNLCSIAWKSSSFLATLWRKSLASPRLTCCRSSESCTHWRRSPMKIV